MAMLGITMVVLSLAVVVNIRGTSLKQRDLEYQLKEETLAKQVALEEDRIYVQTKQYVEQVAKEKLGLVNKDEILLKPAN